MSSSCWDASLNLVNFGLRPRNGVVLETFSTLFFPFLLSQLDEYMNALCLKIGEIILSVLEIIESLII